MPSANHHIHLASPADVPAIVEIANYYALHSAANFAIEPEPLEEWIRDFEKTQAMYPWLVAEADESGTILGFAKASPWKGRCAYAYAAEITVYLRPEARGQGLGRALYERLLTTMKAQGYRTVLGGITQPNEASVRLHESFGLKRVALLEKVGWKFGQWHDVGYWQGSLRGEEEEASGVRGQTSEPEAEPGPIRPVLEVVSDDLRHPPNAS